MSCLPHAVSTFQVNVALPALCSLAPTVSVAATVTWYVPALAGVPVTLPVAALMDRPGGRPVAVQPVIFAPALEDADSCSDAALPTTPVCVPGDLTVTWSGQRLAHAELVQHGIGQGGRVGGGQITRRRRGRLRGHAPVPGGPAGSSAASLSEARLALRIV